MKSKHQVFVSFIIYGLGLLSLLSVDIYISTKFSVDEISKWAGLKSIVFLLGGVCLLGFEQVLVRSPKYINALYKRLLLQIIILSFLLSVIVWLFFEQYGFLIVFLSVLFYSLNQFHFSIFRATRCFINSQLATNFWKVILLVSVVLTFNIGYSLVFSLFLILTISIILFYRFYPQERDIPDSNQYKTLRIEGVAFAFHNLTLVAAIYGEQFFINLYDDKIASTILFTHFAYLTPIALSVNGFIGFYLSPKLRQVKNMTSKIYYDLFVKIFIYSLSISFISYFVGYYIFYYLNKEDLFSMTIALPVIVTCFFRGCYVLSSSVLGVFAPKDMLIKTAKLNWVILIIYISSLVLSLMFYDGYQAAMLISVLSMMHWFLRLLVSQLYSKKIIGEL